MRPSYLYIESIIFFVILLLVKIEVLNTNFIVINIILAPHIIIYGILSAKEILQKRNK